MSALRQKKPRSLYVVLAALCLMLAIWSWLAFAANRPQTLDERTRYVASQLRCPVCHGESVADSPAALAQQMRQNIREQVQAGKSDQDIITYFIARYGEENVSWSPPMQGFTVLAWVVPVLLFVIGLLMLVFVARDWLATAAAERVSAQAGVTHPVLEPVADDELAPYQARLQEELAAADPLFWSTKKEAQ